LPFDFNVKAPTVLRGAIARISQRLGRLANV
jgi:hypothetical protein